MEVLMVMYYKDMKGVNIAGVLMKFKVPKKLTVFPSDYDPSNPNHSITIELVSPLAVSIIREKVIPLIQRFTLNASL
jgi:hypothetical protein